MDKWLEGLLAAFVIVVIGGVAIFLLGWTKTTDPYAQYGLGLVSGLVGTAIWEIATKKA